MNLHAAILKEHSKAQTNKLINYIGTDTSKFAELMKLFLGNEYRVTQRSAWVVGYVAGYHPEMIHPYLKKIIVNLKKPVHNAVKRNTLRLLQFVVVPKTLQGQLFEICFQFMNSKEEPIAVKVFSMTVLKNFCIEEPELKKELIALIESQFEYSSTGYQARAKRVLRELNNKN